MQENVKEQSTRKKDIDIHNIKPTKLTRIDADKVYDKLKSQGFNESQMKKILKSFNRLPHNQMETIKTMYDSIYDDDDLLYKTHVALLHLKNPVVTQILSISPLGLFGIDRFYIKDKSSGLTKLFTLGILTIFWFYDMFTLKERTKYNNYLLIKRVMGYEDEEFNLEKLNQYNK